MDDSHKNSIYLPITHSDKIVQGTQDLPTIIETNSIYVDKTSYISHWVLTGTGRTNLMHRPRRFGKTLTFSVIKEIYSKNKALFKGTQLTEAFWDQIQPRPVISLSFIMHPRDPIATLEYTVKESMLYQMEDFGILQEGDGALTGAQLISTAISRLGRKDPAHKPVILIDEYDALLICAYEQGTSLKEAANVLSEYIQPLKYKNSSIHAAYIIGIMKCQGLQLMSAVNNPNDRTFAPEYAQMIGITMEEIKEYFTPELEKLQKKFELSMEELLHQIKVNYNGYSFCDECLDKTVYAGYSLCIFMAEASSFRTFWYSTGSINILYTRAKDQLDKIKTLIDHGQITGSLTDLKNGQSTINESRIELTTLLFYHGYLTFKEKSEGNQCTFCFPNDEVKKSFSKNYAEYFLKLSSSALSTGLEELKNYIRTCQIDQFMLLFGQLIAIIPGILHTYAEKYYHTVILTCLSIAYGSAVRSEQPVAGGIPDLVLDLGDLVYIFEFKYIATHASDAPLLSALEKAERQVLSKQYYQAYSGKKKLFSIGIVISGEKNNIAGYKIIQEMNNGIASSSQTPSTAILFPVNAIKPRWVNHSLKEETPPEEITAPSSQVEAIGTKNTPEVKSQEEEIVALQNKLLLMEATARAEKAEADALAAKALADALAAKAETDALAAKAETDALAAKAEADALAAKAQADADALAAKAQADADALTAKAQADAIAQAQATKVKLILRLKLQGLSSENICSVMTISPEEWEDLTGETL